MSTTTPPPGDHLGAFLALGSAEAVAANMAERRASWTSPVGVAAQTACIVLASRQMERTAVRLDQAGSRLAVASLALSGAAVVIALLAWLVPRF